MGVRSLVLFTRDGLPRWRDLDTEARQFRFHIRKLSGQRKAEAFPSLEAARQYVDALDSVFAHSQRHARTDKAVPGSAVEHKIDISGDCDALLRRISSGSRRTAPGIAATP